MSKVALIIPCYNEEKRLNFSAIEDHINSYGQVDILFVNDGSRDKTWEMIEEFRTKSQLQLERVMSLNLTSNVGKNEAIRKGFQLIVSKEKYKYTGYWDADLAAPLSELPEMLELISSSSDIAAVLGTRVKLAGRDIRRKALRHYLGRIFATCVDIVFKLGVYDTQCGAKIFTTDIIRGVVEEPFYTHWIFDVELLLRIKHLEDGKLPHKLYEKPLNFWADVKGSKVSIWDYFKSFFDFLTLIKNYHKARNYSNSK